MLRSNKDKLGILAFIQESMKGFPDGIPTIAEEVMAKMGVDPQQLIQEAQPQPQEGQAPEQEMSPEEQQMMMAMQQQGAPMEGDMPMQQYGGLTKFDRGGEMRLVNGLRNAGYQVVYPQNGTVKIRLNPNSQEFTTLSLNKDLSQLQSLVDKPIGQNSKFENGKIYTFKSRPGTYYKVDENGNMLVKNENTGWKYTPMEDPRGERRKVLEAGLDSGLTSEFRKAKPSTGIPGFESKAEFEEFKNSGSTEMVVGEEYQKALKSKDPKVMMALADELEKEDPNVDNSFGFIPWSNQDKVNDIPKMLREEAAKILNQKQKEKFLANDANNTSTKLTELVKHYETQYQKTTDINQKFKIAKDLKTAKLYLEKVKSPEYKKWIGSVKSSNPVTSPDLFGGSSWKGDFAKDELVDPYSTRFQDVNNLTWTEVLDFANKNYSLIKGKPYEKTTFIGDNINNPRDVYDAVPSNKSAVTQSVNPARNFTTLNGKRYQLTPDTELGHYIYNEVGDDGSVLPITDPTLYTQLNDKFTTQYGKPIKATPPPIETPQSWTEDLVNNESVIANVEPVVEPTAKEQLRAAPTVQRKPIITPAQNQVAPANYTPPSKYEGGLSDEDFNNLFKQFGGEIDEYEEGGIVDSFGHMMKLPKHILKQYDPGGPVKSDVTEKTLGTKKVKTWTETYGEGDKSTVIEVVADESGNIISRRNKTTNMPVRSNEKIYRSVYEPVTEQNLTQEEKDVIAKTWKGDTKEYLDYQNMRNKFLLDKELKTKMWEQFDQDRKDAELGMYTGSDKNSRLKSYNRKVRKEWDPKTNKYIYRTVGYDVEHMSQDDLMQELLNQEERNRRLKLYGLGDVKDQAVHGDIDFDKNDRHKGFINKSAYDIIQANPDAFSDVDFSRGHMSQAAYIGYQRALQNNPTLFPNYAAEQTGQGDETVFGLKGKISGSEGASTDTTLKEFMGYKGKAEKEEKEVETETAQGKWYCVTAEDGTKSVVQGSVAFDGTQVPPTGQDGIEGYADQKSAEAVCNVKTLDKQIPQDEYDGWFMPDIVNYATAMGQRTPFTMPALRQMQAAPSGYDLTNPIQKIAADQSNAKQISDQLFNTMDANTAAATMMGNRSLENLNAGITSTEEENKKDVNQNYQNIAQRAMQVDQFNTQARDAYDTKVATVVDERGKDLNQLAAKRAELYGVGFWNAARDTGNRVMYPQAKHINRLTGAYDGFGGGRDPLADDTYYSPVSGRNGTVDVSATAAAEYQRVKKELIAGGMDEKEAAAQAELASKQVYEDYKFNRTKKTGQQNYSSNVNSYGSHKFGGSIDFGAHAPDYDFGF
jgi:hypothetical protein